MTTEKVKATSDLKNLSILPEHSAEGLRSKRECCWLYVVSVLENTHTNIVVQRRVQLEHSSPIAKVGVKVTFLHVNPWCILKETPETAGPFGTMPQKPWHPGKRAKPERVLQLNCRVVRTYSSYKTTRTWENFNEQKWSSFQTTYDKELITKSFAERSKTIIRNNLGLCKHFEI